MCMQDKKGGWGLGLVQMPQFFSSRWDPGPRRGHFDVATPAEAAREGYKGRSVSPGGCVSGVGLSSDLGWRGASSSCWQALGGPPAWWLRDPAGPWFPYPAATAASPLHSTATGAQAPDGPVWVRKQMLPQLTVDSTILNEGQQTFLCK